MNDGSLEKDERVDFMRFDSQPIFDGELCPSKGNEIEIVDALILDAQRISYRRRMGSRERTHRQIGQPDRFIPFPRSDINTRCSYESGILTPFELANLLGLSKEGFRTLKQATTAKVDATLTHKLFRFGL